jgi:hypothetical protein
MKNQNHGGGSVHTVALPMLRFVKFYFNISLIFFFCSGSYAQQSPAIKKPGTAIGPDPQLERTVRNTLKQNSQKLQLIENKGQSGLSPDVVAYFSSGNEMMFIEKNRLRIVVVESEEKGTDAINKNNKSQAAEPAAKKYHYNSFSILFKDSKGFSGIEKTNPFTTKRNYINAGYIGCNSITAASYGEIILKNIYDGIDLRLYSQQDGHMEFDWIVWPGHDAAKIKMEFEGQKSLGISAMGNLEVRLGMGAFTMRLPESYYVTPTGKQNVNAKFRMSGKNEIQFRGFDKKFKKYPLVIDPDLLWGTFFDGANINFDEYLYGIEFNYNNDLIYCAGAANLQVSATYAAALSSTYDSTFAAGQDVLIYALTKDGQFIQHITYLGGAGNDVGIGVSISSSFVYVCGYTASADFPVTKAADGLYPAFDSVYHGNNEGFIAVFNLKLDTLEYCSFLGGDGNDKALTVRAVADSSFFISLSATDTLPVSPEYIIDEADSIYGGNSEAWIGKFNSFNALRFGTYVGGNNDDLINDFQVLGNGDIVFAGSTRNITEVNAYIPNNSTGQEALFGRIYVPATGPVIFVIIDKIGGSNNDYGWGIYNLGDSISIMVGQTNSNNFPLGTGPVFQNTRGGQYDGFIAKIYNDASAGYKATFTGGSSDEILVSVRPVTVNNQVALLSWGTTASTDLVTRNFNSGTFFSANNTGGLDMMFVICDMNFVTKYYLSYIGGSANDYLGATGAPIGANHLFYNFVDSALYLGTTTHSLQNTQVPKFVGRGPADIIHNGIPVFDSTKGNGINDTHIILAISTASLFSILPMQWLDFKTQALSDCSVQLIWKTAHEEKVLRYIVERSTDGRNFATTGSLLSRNNVYTYTDRNTTAIHGKIYYRIAALEMDGRKLYSAVQVVEGCGQQNGQINIYPVLIQNSFSISGLSPDQNATIQVEVINAEGKRIAIEKLSGNVGAQTVYFQSKPAAGTYFVMLKDIGTGTILVTQKIIIGY